MVCDTGAGGEKGEDGICVPIVVCSGVNGFATTGLVEVFEA
jgi:hypothetical protein